MGKKTTINEHTGDSLVSKPSNDAYAEGYERIFGKKNPVAKNAGINKASTHVDKKKEAKKDGTYYETE